MSRYLPLVALALFAPLRSARAQDPGVAPVKTLNSIDMFRELPSGARKATRIAR